MLTAVIVACNDDTDFSTDFNHKLLFSADTIRFDTLFTTLSSSRSGAVVYNFNDKDLRILSVELADGSSSAFNVMVDGQYGAAMRDLEVRSGDSLYVFVNVLPELNGSDVPQFLSDKLVFTLESGVQQSIVLEAHSRDAVFMNAVTVNSDSVIKRGHYVVYDSLVVAPEVTLTIEPGVNLYFHDDVPMVVRGSIVARGTRNAPIVLRGDRTDRIFSYLPYDRLPGQWNGVVLASTSNGNIFEYCDIHSANYGIKMEPGDASVQRLTMNASRLQNFYGNALELVNAQADFTNSLIANAGGNCVKIVGGRVSFAHCTIANFFVFKVRDVALSLYNHNGTEDAPLYGANFVNCIITGSREDEVMGYFLPEDKAVPGSENIRFENSLLNTVVPEGDERFVNVLVDAAATPPFANAHFTTVNHDIYYYDFHLSELSTARSMGNELFIADDILKSDIDGVLREPGSVDVGCYQYVASATE